MIRATSSAFTTHPGRGAPLNGRGVRGFDTGPHGPLLGLPFGEAAVEDRYRVVTEPAQQPPETAGEDAVVLVVGDDLHGVVDAPAAKGDSERCRVRLRMPSVPPVLLPGQIAIQAGVHGARDVSLLVVPRPAASSARSKRQSTMTSAGSDSRSASV